MERIVVVGTSGSGKTTLGRALGEVLEIPHLEMDSEFHREGWDSTPDDEFGEILREFAAQSTWVADGNYTSHGSREHLWPRADTFIWLDLPKRTIMRRVVARTLKRVVTREKLWGTVVEPWSNLYSTDPYKNLMLWAWQTYDHNREKYEKMIADGSWSHAEVYRLRTPAEVDSFVVGLRPDR